MFICHSLLAQSQLIEIIWLDLNLEFKQIIYVFIIAFYGLINA